MIKYCSPRTAPISKVIIGGNVWPADMQFWMSARSPTDVVWGTVSNILDKPLHIRGCGELCYKFGQDFARID